MYHDQHCCEYVAISEISGDLQDLLGSPILQASEETNEDIPEDEDNEFDHNSFAMWTFYKLATIKWRVSICWHGESNGYYSVSVSVAKLGTKEYDC